METNGTNPVLDMQIASLLDCRDDSVSIVDRLMCMPQDLASGGSQWDRAVALRLERRLSDSVRGLIEGADSRAA